MDKIFLIGALVAMAAVVASFLIGIFAMAGEDEKKRTLSNKMMRFRVLFQALALFLLFLAYVAK